MWTFSTFQAQHTRTSLRTTDLRDWTISSVARTILGVKRVVRTRGGGTNMSCGFSWYETPSGKKWSQWAHFLPTSLQFNIKQWLNIWKLKTYFPPSSFLYTDLQVQFRTSLCAGGGKYIYDQGQNYRLSVQLNKVEEGFSKMHLKKIFPFQTCLLHFFLCITV